MAELTTNNCFGHITAEFNFNIIDFLNVISGYIISQWLVLNLI